MLPLVGANVTYNRAATEAAREAEAASVQRALVVLKRNQTVAREGDTVTPQMLGQFQAIRIYSRTERRPHLYLGLFIFACALYWGAWRFTEYRATITTLPLSAARGFALVWLSVLAGLALMRVGFALAEGIAAQSTHAPTNDVSLWMFAIPYAAAALLVALLVDTQLALITAVLTAVYAGLLELTATTQRLVISLDDSAVSAVVDSVTLLQMTFAELEADAAALHTEAVR